MSVSLAGACPTPFATDYASPWTWNITTPAGTTKLVIVLTNRPGGGDTHVTGVTFNGVTMTARKEVVGVDPMRLAIFDLDSPDIGTYDVVATFSDTTPGMMQAVFLTGAAAGTPGDTGSSTSTMAATVSSTSGGLVIAAAASHPGNQPPDHTIALAAGTEIANLVGTAGYSTFGAAYQTGTGSPVTTTWTPYDSGDYQAALAISYDAGGGGGGSIIIPPHLFSSIVR